MGRREARLSQPHCAPCCLCSLWRMGGCVGREVPGPDANFTRPLTPLPGFMPSRGPHFQPFHLQIPLGSSCPPLQSHTLIEHLLHASPVQDAGDMPPNRTNTIPDLARAAGLLHKEHSTTNRCLGDEGRSGGLRWAPRGGALSWVRVPCHPEPGKGEKEGSKEGGKFTAWRAGLGAEGTLRPMGALGSSGTWPLGKCSLWPLYGRQTTLGGRDGESGGTVLSPTRRCPHRPPTLVAQDGQGGRVALGEGTGLSSPRLHLLVRHTPA